MFTRQVYRGKGLKDLRFQKDKNRDQKNITEQAGAAKKSKEII